MASVLAYEFSPALGRPLHDASSKAPRFVILRAVVEG